MIAKPEWRFGDLDIHSTLVVVVCIREDYTNPSPGVFQTTLVVLDMEKRSVTTIAEGWDFYADLTFSSDSRRIAYTRWNHLDSAFHSMQLGVADVVIGNEGIALANEVVVAGEPGKSIAQQPQWLFNDDLMFTYDVSGWGQPWRFTVETSARPILQSPIAENFALVPWHFHLCSSKLKFSDLQCPYRGSCKAMRLGGQPWVAVAA